MNLSLSDSISTTFIAKSGVQFPLGYSFSSLPNTKKEALVYDKKYFKKDVSTDPLVPYKSK